MKLRLPKYTSKDYVVLALVLLPYILAMNSIIFWCCLYQRGTILFAFHFHYRHFLFCFFVICGGVAVLMKKHFPSEREMGRRFTYMIFTFLLMSGLFLLLLFQGYEDIDFFNYRFDDDSFVWAYFGLGIGNVFLTFLHEGIARYENWKANLQETEQLKK